MNIYAIGETIFCVGQAFPLAVAGRPPARSLPSGLEALRAGSGLGENACPTIRPPASSMPATSRSGSEAFAAGAMRDGIRVGNFKTAFLQIVTEIEHGAADEECALGIDHNPNIE